MLHHRLTVLALLVAIGGTLGSGTNAGAQATPKDWRSAAAAESTLVWTTYVSIHEHPELGKREYRTHDLIKSTLQSFGYTQFFESVAAPTAVITLLDTGKPGPTIALRAEMDARPGQEPASHSPRSMIDSVMHSCGHDAHAAMLLGAAHLLRQNASALQGRIVFVFQPAEETKGGADDIVNEKILTKLGVQAIFAQHATAQSPVGTVSISSGPTLAGSSYFTLTVHGRGSHAASPSSGDDVLLAAASMVRGMAELPARRFDPLTRPVIISPTYFVAGSPTATNVLPSEATVQGTIRVFESLRAAAPDGTTIERTLREYVTALSSVLGVTSTLTIADGSPPTVNDSSLFNRLAPILRSRVGPSFDTSPQRGMFSEDFAYYTATIPALYFGWGIARDGLGGVTVHSTDFTIHSAALVEGVRFLAILAEVATK
jgi:amidohydrolase